MATNAIGTQWIESVINVSPEYRSGLEKPTGSGSHRYDKAIIRISEYIKSGYYWAQTEVII